MRKLVKRNVQPQLVNCVLAYHLSLAVTLKALEICNSMLNQITNIIANCSYQFYQI